MILYEPYPRSKEEIEDWFKSNKRKQIKDIYIRNKEYLEAINPSFVCTVTNNKFQ